MRMCPAPRHSPEWLEFVQTVEAEALHCFVRLPPAHRNSYRTVGKGVGKISNQSHNLRRPGREHPRLVIVTHRPDHPSARSVVAAVQDTTKLFPISEDETGRRRVYRVVESFVTDARDADVMAPTPDARLTLVTCWPFDAPVPGGGQRYVVVAEMT